MNESQGAINPRFRVAVFAVVILALSVLSFLGPLDDFAYEGIKETTKETIGIYALSKAINASISVLQTTHVSAGIASITPGELLDPINDGIERLSSMVVWAIGSLFFQRIVLEVAASTLFKWIFLGTGLTAFFALLPLGSTRCRDLVCQVSGLSPGALDSFCHGLIRIFAIAAVLRFIVPVFVATSFLVSEMLLQSKLDRNRDELTAMSRQVSDETGTIPSAGAELVGQRNKTASELVTLKKSKSDYEKKLLDLDAKITARSEKEGLGWWVPQILGGTSPDNEVVALRAKREDLRSKAQDVTQLIEKTENELECIGRRMKGKSCGSLLQRLSEASKTGVEKIGKLVNAANDYLVLIANTAIALFIKNILFPLLFLYIALKSGMYVIRRGSNLRLSLQQELSQTGTDLQRIGNGSGGPQTE